MFWLRFYVNNAAKTRPMAAFSYENAAIDLRQSGVQTKCGEVQDGGGQTHGQTHTHDTTEREIARGKESVRDRGQEVLTYDG